MPIKDDQPPPEEISQGNRKVTHRPSDQASRAGLRFRLLRDAAVCLLLRAEFRDVAAACEPDAVALAQMSESRSSTFEIAAGPSCNGGN